jgi:ABC-type uncharacterized transport system involved in gliding motility auxiliary subunit
MAYFMQGHGETSFADTTENGYQKFLLALAQNDIVMDNLEIAGDTDIPADCSLLVIAGPVKQFSEAELRKVDRYLTEGGKLMLLLGYNSLRQPSGVEAVLQRWNINVLRDYVKDPQSSGSDQYVYVRNFNDKTFVAPLRQLALEMVLPRPIMSMGTPAQGANAPVAEVLVASSDVSTLGFAPASGAQQYPLIVSVEQKPVAGVTNPRGNTRIVVSGDSFFLDNQLIETGANRDFLNYAVNWLCDREEMLQGVGPRPVTEFRLTLSHKQHQQLRWLLLGALPGGVLVFGWLVWLIRRK